MSKRCTATNKAGEPCRRPALPGRRRCRYHARPESRPRPIRDYLAAGATCRDRVGGFRTVAGQADCRTGRYQNRILRRTTP